MTSFTAHLKMTASKWIAKKKIAAMEAGRRQRIKRMTWKTTRPRKKIPSCARGRLTGRSAPSRMGGGIRHIHFPYHILPAYIPTTSTCNTTCLHPSNMLKSKYCLRKSFDNCNHRTSLTTYNNLNITLLLPVPNTLFQAHVPHPICFCCPCFTNIFPPCTTFILRSPVVPERVTPSSRLGSTSSAVGVSAASFRCIDYTNHVDSSYHLSICADCASRTYSVCIGNTNPIPSMDNFAEVSRGRLGTLEGSVACAEEKCSSIGPYRSYSRMIISE